MLCAEATQILCTQPTGTQICLELQHGSVIRCSIDLKYAIWSNKIVSFSLVLYRTEWNSCLSWTAWITNKSVLSGAYLNQTRTVKWTLRSVGEEPKLNERYSQQFNVYFSCTLFLRWSLIRIETVFDSSSNHFFICLSVLFFQS